MVFLSNNDSTRPKNLQILRNNRLNQFRKSFMGLRFCKKWLSGTKGAKISVEEQKGSQGVQNQKICYISAIMTLQGPKNWQILIPNWTIALEKALWALVCIKIGYWASKAQKQKSSSKKGPRGVQNQKICYISAIMTLQGPKIGKCWYLNGTIASKKVLWALDFVKIAYWAPKAQK